MTKTDRLIQVIVEYGEPIRTAELAELAGIGSNQISGFLRAPLKHGRVAKVGYGLWAAPGAQTLSGVLDIPVTKTIAPVVPVDRGVELSPPTRKDTAAALLSAISDSGDVRRYAGVIQEIGKVLAS